jgi:HEPN domain-containing protein
MNIEEAIRWFKQAKADIESAKDSLATKHFDWACFQAQQSGEKALKAFLYKQGLRAILTHSVRDLLNECGKYENTFLDFADHGRSLDTFYIPSRYPNGLPGKNYPADFYTKKDADKCISSAVLILQEVEKFITI